MINLWWMLSPNYGDALSPVIARIISNDPVVAFTPLSEPHVIVCGSVLNHATEHSRVWGAGLANVTDSVNSAAKVLATRGPLSREIAISCGVESFSAFGDPGLLVKRLWVPPPTLRAGTGTVLVPHYIDFRHVILWNDTYPVVDVLGSVSAVDFSIFRAERVVASSLHGLVAAVAHNIPFAWVSFGNEILGDGFKFRDFFASFKLEIDVQHVASPDDIETLRYYEVPERLVYERIDALMEVCPWR